LIIQNYKQWFSSITKKCAVDIPKGKVAGLALCFNAEDLNVEAGA
jgi:hypothetical protein